MKRLVRPLLLPIVLSLPAAAQLPQPGASGVVTEVVVTAGAVPEDAASLGVATTVVDRATIERSRAATVTDLLRTVAGVDVAQSGGPGGVTSLFLRGANSNSTLVLVDGVKMNSPYFGGVDLSSLGTANIERIEIVRGPFSALYGSEALGGVVQVITRRAAAGGLEGQAHFGVGNASAREGGVNAAFRDGAIGVTAGLRRGTVGGDLPNEFFEGTDLSAALDVELGPDVKTGLTVRRESSRTGIPFSGSTPTPLRATTADTTLVSVPFSLGLGARTTLEAAATWAGSFPDLHRPRRPVGLHLLRDAGHGEPEAGSSSRTPPARIGSPPAPTWSGRRSRTRTPTGCSWTVCRRERGRSSSRTASPSPGDRLAITAGVRRDENDAFGASTNPRVALSWRVSKAMRVRAAAGSAFRAPSTGELYYPFSGNPDLQPEQSVSYEAGAEWTLAKGLALEASLFRSDVKDLIRYDFAYQENVNVGRARMTGADVVLSGSVTASTWARASYTWLDTEDRDSGLALLRRPKQRASVTFGGDLGRGASAELTGLWVGERADVDATTYLRVTNPAYFRFDVAVTGPRLFGGVSPFVRVTNLLDRDYDEVAGYPSPGRRFVAGLDLAF